MRFGRLIAVVAAMTGAACLETAAPAPGPLVQAIVVARDTANALQAWAEVRATGFDSASVHFWRAGDAGATSPWYPFADSVARVPLLGLRAETSYSAEVRLLGADGLVVADTQQVVTGSLPPWVPSIGADGVDTVPGVLLLALPDGAVAVDNGGVVVWYRAYAGGILSSIQAHPNGRYTALGNTDTLRRYHVFDETGAEVDTIGCVGLPTRFHAVRMAADGSWWVLCDDERVQDLTAVGGLPDAVVTWTVLQHVASDGTLLFAWNSADHVAPTEIPLDARDGPAVNATHGNAIDLAADGTVVVSFRTLSAVFRIDPADGRVLWRLGGLASDFTFANDARNGFSGQHGVRLAGPGQIQMLDNGAAPPSRLARYQLDPDSGSALLLMDVRDGGTFTAVGGATQAYAGGGAVVTFGRAGRVLEVDAVGRATWRLTGLDGVYVFRAQRLPSLYGRDFGLPAGTPAPR